MRIKDRIEKYGSIEAADAALSERHKSAVEDAAAGDPGEGEEPVYDLASEVVEVAKGYDPDDWKRAHQIIRHYGAMIRHGEAHSSYYALPGGTVCVRSHTQIDRVPSWCSVRDDNGQCGRHATRRAISANGDRLADLCDHHIRQTEMVARIKLYGISVVPIR